MRSQPELTRIVKRIASLFTRDKLSSRLRHRLLIEQLCSRDVLSADTPCLQHFSNHIVEGEDVRGALVAEGESANDLVAFANLLRGAGATMYGADWNATTTQQLRLFEDGANYLNFVESTNPDRTLNAVAQQNNVQSFPTWLFGDGSRVEGILTLAELSQRTGIAIPQSSTPTFAAVAATTVLSGSPLHIPIDAYDPNGNPLTISVTSSDPSVIAAESLAASRSVRMAIEDRGDIVFQLFEQEVPQTTNRIVSLVEDGFYDSVGKRMLFHRVVDNFVIQTGESSSTTNPAAIDDEFNLNLQYNRTGVIGMARTAARDTGASQFFITAGPQRFLDFGYSIIGQVVEGESVRQGISRTPTNGAPADRPLNDVLVQDTTVFDDTENGLIRLTARAQSGSATIRVTVTDTEGNSYSQEFVATVQNDTSNSRPFLNTVPTNISTTSGQTVNIQLTSQDAEGDAPIYSAVRLGSTNFDFAIDSATGLLRVTAPQGFVGTLQLRATVAQAAPNDGLSNDTQIISINVDANTVTLADLAVSLTSSQIQVTAGQQVTYNLFVSNFGPGTAQDVRVTISLPNGFTFISGAGPLGIVSVVNGVLTVSVSTLSTGSTASFTISASTSRTLSGFFLASATVVPGTFTDPFVNNNIASASTTVTPAITNNSISGYVYVDTNDDGDRFVNFNGQRLAHLGIPNVLVELRSLDNSIVSTTRTNASGFYEFLNVSDGVYSVSEIQPFNFMDGKDTAGTPFLNGVQRNDVFLFFVGGSVTATEFNFGEVGMVNPGKRQTLASAPSGSELVRQLTANQLRAFQAPAAGTLILRKVEDGRMQLLNGEGETLAGTQTSQLAYPMSALGTVYIHSETDVQLQFLQEPVAPIVLGAMTNRALPVDVNQDSHLTALDALLVINQLNRGGGRQLLSTDESLGMIDVNQDGRLTPLDALLIINSLNQQQAAGEGEKMEFVFDTHSDIDRAKLQTPGRSMLQSKPLR